MGPIGAIGVEYPGVAHRGTRSAFGAPKVLRGAATFTEGDDGDAARSATRRRSGDLG